jgi:signal transduction histidine kinase
VRSRRTNTDIAARQAASHTASGAQAAQATRPPVAAPAPNGQRGADDHRGPADEGGPLGAASGPGGPAGAAGPAATPRGSRTLLKNWRVRSRLLLLITAPTLAALILGGFSVSSSVLNALAYQRTEQTARLAGQVTNLVQALQNERTDTVRFITMGSSGGRVNALSANKAAQQQAQLELEVLSTDYNATDRAAAGVQDLAGHIDGSYPALAQQEAQDAITVIKDLPSLRHASEHTQLPSVVVVAKYGDDIAQLLTLESEVSAASSDATLADTVRALGLISNVKEEAAQEQALLTSALTSGLIGANQLGSGSLSAINNAAAEQNANTAAFLLQATPAQRQLYDSAVSSPAAARAQQQVNQAIQQQNSGHLNGNNPVFVDAANGAYYTVGSLRHVEQQLMNSVIDLGASLRNKAITAAVIGGVAAALVLVLALLLTAVVGRSMIRPLRRLRAGALEVAGVRLPETVRRMSESDGAGVLLDVTPMEVDSTDEIGEVARAFDQVHREAIRLAANEAALRGNVNAMFVNLSRRSQSLIERQIQLIDELEQGEQDPDQLASLFQMDHLATRMRRNSENLLVLAGHDLSRRLNEPVVLVDVLRAAVSEIEQYARVNLSVQSGIAVRGPAVNDVVHLLAELAENATSFSSAETPVTISGHLLSSGGVLLDITDQGVGMGAEEMAHANWRLDNPPVVDVAVSRRMGLFVVARLAARHGIRVRLRPAGSGGLTALVWLPDEVISRESGVTPQGSRLPDGMADTSSGLPSMAGFSAGPQVDERAATAQEVSAARTPKFASLAETGQNGNLVPRRVPGAGPRPGTGAGAGTTSWNTTETGPLPSFRTSPQPAEGTEEPFATSPQQAAEPGTSPMPAVGHDATSSGWPEPPAAASPSGASRSETSGNGQQLPKRVVDRDAQPTSAAPAAGGDIFSPAPSTRAGRASASPTGSGPELEPETTGGAQGAQPAEVGAGPVFSAPASTDEISLGTNGSGGFGWDATPTGDNVVVPVPGQDQEYRLPIFEAVESDWFRRGRSSVGWSPQAPGAAEVQGYAPARTGGNWASAADQGWQAAAAAAAPTSGGLTTAGLPKRVPKANLVPGTAGAEAQAPAPVRSAAQTRDRFASFQRGVREGRAAAASGEGAAGEDDGAR